MHPFKNSIQSKLLVKIHHLIFIAVASFMIVKPLSAAVPIEAERVIIQLKWSHQFQFAGYYAAIEKGFYTEENLNVVLKELDTEKGFIAPVLSGEAHYGVADAGLLLNRLSGEPVVLLRQIFQYSPRVLTTLADSGITSPYDLKGKLIMRGEDTGDHSIHLMLQDSIGKIDQSNLAPSYDLSAFKNGNTDALESYSTTQLFDLRQAGYKINAIEPRDFDINLYGDNLFTTESEIKEHPSRVDAMIRATTKGWQYALKHPDEIIQLIREKYKPNLSQSRLEFEAQKTAQLIMPDKIPLGSIVPRRFTDIADTYRRAGLINSSDWGDFIYQQQVGNSRFESQFFQGLNKKQQYWLAEHPVLRVGYTSDFAPYVFQIKGKATGYSIDYIKLLAQRLGIKLEFVYDSFTELLNKAKNRELDLIPSALNFPKERETFLNFTQGYKDSGSVIVTRNDTLPVNSAQDLIGRTVALVKGNASSALFKKNFPRIKIITVDDYEEALKLVAFGQVDATTSARTIFINLRRKLMLNNLKVATELVTPEKEDSKIRLAVRKDWPLLVAILEKAMDDLSDDELKVIEDRWLMPVKAKIIVNKKNAVQQNLLLQPQNLLLAILAFLVFLAIIFVLFRRLNRKNKSRLTDQLPSPEINRSLVTLVNGILIAVAIILAWWALENIEDKVKQNMQGSLLAVLNTSQEALKLWSSEQKRQLKSHAVHTEVITETKQQLKNYQQGFELKNTDELKELRTLFGDLQERGDRLGFFIIAPDGTNIFSMRDANLGAVNLIKKQRPDLLRRAFNGEAVMVPPIQSDVPIAGVSAIAGSVMPPTMFFMVPVSDLQGNVMAVLAERFNPHGTFSSLFQLGQIGKTGETYSFNRHGQMLSDSRFYGDLVTTELLQTTNKSILSIQLRDPGVNLVAGYKSNISKDKQDLTRMAKSAIAGNSDLDIHGYRDYRGVPVIGAWSWDESLGLGIAVEIDLDEAMEAYYSARTVVLMTLIITVVTAVFSSLLIMLLTSRSSRQLLAAQAQLERRVEQRTNDLQLSEARLQMVIDNVPGPVFFKDEQGRHQMVNTQFEQATGINREFALGKTDSQLFPPAVANEIIETDKLVISAGKTIQFEEQIPNKTGRLHDYLTTKVPITSATNQGLVGVALDITERKQAELKLKQVLLDFNEQRYVLDQHAIVGVTDLSGTITYANQKFADISGYQVDELIGKNHNMLNSGIHCHKFWQDMYRTVKAGGVWNNEICNRAKDGKIYWVETTIAAFKAEDGKPTAYIAIRTDISARKRYEEKMQRAIAHAEAANIAKSEFVASMSHEIRTPMNGVLGMLDLLSTSALSNEQQHHVKIAQNSGQTLLTLINDILDFSKVEAGKLELEELDFNLPDLLEDIKQTLAFRAEEKGLTLLLDVKGVEHNMVKGDPSRLRQIILNLVSNAIKFTDVGKIIIDAKLKPLNAENLLFECTITDTGIGIPKEAIDGLFDSFTQVDASTTRKFGGTGLGLTICKKLCYLMRGDISVNSELGEGSSFKFNLLFKLVELKNTPKLSNLQDVIPDTLPVWPTKARLLLVEDNQVNQMVLKAMLKRLGLSCDIAGNGLEAIASLQKTPPDAPYTLVFMDCQMPELDGYQTTLQIRTAVAGELYSTVPIIAMTANAMQGDKEKCLTAGMDDYLAKPLKPQSLLAALRKWLFLSQSLKSTGDESKLTAETNDNLTTRLFLAENLLESCGNDQQMAVELLEVFMLHSTIDKDALILAYNNGDNSEVAKLAHKIKGSISYVAAKTLSEQAGTIELMAASNNTIRIAEIMGAFIDGLNVLHAEADAWFDACQCEYIDSK
ncbi:ABC transporter substrate-binding protein [Thalassotalea psychrophila]|uniref:histidine kinase n=1 Tax=Thalassotalea psychrophila TaxID=3065647 RepID=A0ABY9TRB5_9GAMM|nr:ABC transporter substrate-binding protein [Colwelliaceae bacterium SQ149]